MTHNGRNPLLDSARLVGLIGILISILIAIAMIYKEDIGANWSALMIIIGLLSIIIVGWMIWITYCLHAIRNELTRIQEIPMSRENIVLDSNISVMDITPIRYDPIVNELDRSSTRMVKREDKIRLKPTFLGFSELTMLFWVNMEDHFITATNNRYLFTYTSDPYDASGYPNAFFMGLESTRRVLRFQLKGPDPQRGHEMSMRCSSILKGWRLVSIIINRYHPKMSLSIDAGQVYKDSVVLEKDMLPQVDTRHNLHIGGWADTWDGGMSALEFYGLRIYKTCLSESDIADMHIKERRHVEGLGK